MTLASHQAPSANRLRIAIVGSGISGLAAAHRLAGAADVTLFEADDYFGGHTHTVDVSLPGAAGTVTHGVDTGFLVFNERTYPNLIQLFDELGVATAKSEMSFSVKVPAAGRKSAMEWSGSSLNSVFAQRGNLLNWRFWRMLRDILRFNRRTSALAKTGAEADMLQPLSEFLLQEKLSDEFRDWYFLPMMGCIWSCPTDQMLQFPVATMIRFCHNHGLIQVANRPQWWTVTGGARHYVDKIIAGIADKRLATPVQTIERHAGGVRITSGAGAARQTEDFDKVFWPPTATRRWPCWRSPARPNRRCWVQWLTKPTAPCCTPTPRCCQRAPWPGPPGTTNAQATAVASPRRFVCITC